MAELFLLAATTVAALYFTRQSIVKVLEAGANE
jgi:ribosomal protein L18E